VLDQGGAVVDVNHNQKSLLQTLYRGRRNGAPIVPVR
jgi:hypothetical protein